MDRPMYKSMPWEGQMTGGMPSFEQRYGPSDVNLAQRMAQGAGYMLDRPIQASMRAGMQGGQAYANARAQGMNPVLAFGQSIDPMAMGVRQGFLGERPDLRGADFTGGDLSGMAMEMLGDPSNIMTGGGSALGKLGLKYGAKIGAKELLPHLATFGLSKRKFLPKVVEGAGGRNLLELYDAAKNLVGKLGYVDRPTEVGFHSIMVSPQYRGKGSGAAYQMFDELDDLLGRERMNQMLMKTPVMPHAKGFFEHMANKVGEQAPDFAQRMRSAADMADFY